jgi:multidrug transporter EmrE-like cation transporter
MNDLLVILAIISIVFTAVSQLLLKTGANITNQHGWIPESLKLYLNRYTLAGYSILFIVTILSIVMLEEMPLRVFFPFFISGNLIAIAVFSHIFLHESFTYSKIAGICLIIAGICLLTL